METQASSRQSNFVSQDVQALMKDETCHSLDRLIRRVKVLVDHGHKLLSQDIALTRRCYVQQQLAEHTRFFQFLSQHWQVIQVLSTRAPEVSPCRSGSLMMELRGDVVSLLEQALEKETNLKETLQMWSRWDEDKIWWDALMNGVQMSYMTLTTGVDLQSVWQELSEDKNRLRLRRMLEDGLRLHAAGCIEVGMVCQQIEAQMKTLKRRAKAQVAQSEIKKNLMRKFFPDSAKLCNWMSEARQTIEMCSQAQKGADPDEKQELFLLMVNVSKELEFWSGLKTTVSSSGSQLLQLLEESSDQDLELDSVTIRLRQVEQDWSSLVTKVPVLLRDLHQHWTDRSNQQVVLHHLLRWFSGVESRLENLRSPVKTCVAADLQALLTSYKMIGSELQAHWLTLDFVKEPIQCCTEDPSQLNQFAEDQGQVCSLGQRLQQEVRFQIHQLERDLRTRNRLSARLREMNKWISDMNLWRVSTPTTLMDIQHSLETCETVELKIQQYLLVLETFRAEAHVDCDVTSATEESLRRLQHHVKMLRPSLTDSHHLWVSVETGLQELRRQGVRVGGTLELLCGPQLCLQGQRLLHARLKNLLEDTEKSESDWNNLTEMMMSLHDVISPAAAQVLDERLNQDRERWTWVLECVRRRLGRSSIVLQSWTNFYTQAASLTQLLLTLQSDITALGGGASEDDITGEDHVDTTIRKIQGSLARVGSLESDLQGVLEASRHLMDHLDPLGASLLQSECRVLTRDLVRQREQLTQRRERLQEEQQSLTQLHCLLDSLEETLDLWLHRLDSRDKGLNHDQGPIRDQGLTQDSAQTQTQNQWTLLQFSGRSADLDLVNELSHDVLLNDATTHRLQLLNFRWRAAEARAEEASSVSQAQMLSRQDFQRQCDLWTSFLQKMEENIAVDVSGSYSGLREQLCIHKWFQAELCSGHQILHSVESEALQMLQRGHVENSTNFVLTLSQLRERWQTVLQRVEQRCSLVESLVKRWHRYMRGLKRLQRFLKEVRALLPPAGPPRCSLQQLQLSLEELKLTQQLFQQNQSGLASTLELGRQLFCAGDQDTQNQIQEQLGTLQEDWETLKRLLGQRLDLTRATIQNWDRCETGLGVEKQKLQRFVSRLERSGPEDPEQPMTFDPIEEEDKDLLEGWAERLAELSVMKSDVSQFLLADDEMLLQQQVKETQQEWEELCLQVSLREQEITDRLSAWMMFDQKNKELCDWLTQMENKVTSSSDLNIEEMVEKLKKDCMEEMNLFSENKTHLNQLGDQLITASNKTKVAELNHKLSNVNKRWQHLFDHIESRVKKLKETLATVQQLDHNMNQLRTWMNQVESDLAEPLIYNVCHHNEIQDKLMEHQELQKKIERHADSVSLVLTLCDVLLHEKDASTSDPEHDYVQHTSVSLDRRWTNICASALDRRIRIEETGRLWSMFLENWSRLHDWLQTAERTAATPDTSDVPYLQAREELKKFEVVQRQVYECLTQLELINKQYRRLACENRTDSSGELKDLVEQGNRRWDELQRRVTAILRRLKHFTSQREEFETTREGILVWLTELDLQLTNVEHFSVSHVQKKIEQLHGFQQDITMHTDGVDALIVFGEVLIQKSCAEDAVLIEEELEELHSYCQEVFGRVARSHQRLVTRQQPLEEELWIDESDELNSGTSWSETRQQGGEESSPLNSHILADQVRCHLLAPPPERFGGETPVSVDSLPLEWDHMVDVGRTSLHEKDDVDFSSPSGASTAQDLWTCTGTPERSLNNRHAKSMRSGYQQGYLSLMSDCTCSINKVQQVQLTLNDHQDLDEFGLTSSSAHKHHDSGVIQRWELLQTQKREEELDLLWQKLNADLCDVTSWLGRILPELERLQEISPCANIQDIENNIQRLKEVQRSFHSHKCLMISVNLAAAHFLQGDCEQLQDALSSANHSWTLACESLDLWQRNLQAGLTQNQEVQESLRSLLQWAACFQNTIQLMQVTDTVLTPNQLQDRHASLKAELQARQGQLASLSAAASELLVDVGEKFTVSEKLHVITNKMQLLQRQWDDHIGSLQTRPKPCDCSGDVASKQDNSDIQPAEPQLPISRQPQISQRRPFIFRILRAAFPLHVLFLTLLVVACLLPAPTGDHGCVAFNNFARSFSPMLSYTNGPPPT